MGQRNSRYSNSEVNDNYVLMSDGINNIDSDININKNVVHSVYNIIPTDVKEELDVKPSFKDILNKQTKDAMEEKKKRKRMLKNEINNYFSETPFFIHDINKSIDNVCSHMSKVAKEGKTSCGLIRDYMQTNADLGVSACDIGICDIGEVYKHVTNKTEWTEISSVVKKRFKEWVETNMTEFVVLFKEHTKCKTDLHVDSQKVSMSISW